MGLEGSVGVIANGAGLAMSTVDMVHQVGGWPANFLDLGGGADADVMTAALEVINDDPTVRSIFVNIFGGITRCEDVANGILEALNRVEIRSPIVIRFDGTTVEEGRALLKPHLGPNLLLASTMLEAARLAVQLAGPYKHAEGGGASVIDIISGGSRARRAVQRWSACERNIGHRFIRHRREDRAMSIFVNERTRVVYQGLTGSQGRYHGLLNRDYGTKVGGRNQPAQSRHRGRGHPGVRHSGRCCGRHRCKRELPVRPRADGEERCVGSRCRWR